MIDSASTTGLILAVVFGLIFGFLLDRGRVTKYAVIVNFFRFKDARVFQIMLTAILVGGIGVWFMHMGGVATYHIKSLQVAGILLGGGMFGVGMASLGYCPGTGIAAIGTGSVHALVGFLGMIAGGIAYGVSYPWWKTNILTIGDFGTQRLPELTHLPEAVIWVAVAIGWVLVIRFAHRLQVKMRVV